MAKSRNGVNMSQAIRDLLKENPKMKAKEIIDSGSLGQLRSVNVRYTADGQSRLDPARLPWRVQAEQAGAGFFLDIASHTLDVLDFLFGPLQAVGGEAKNALAPGDVEDQVALRFTTQTGAPGSGYWNFSSPTYEDMIEIVGAAGRLRLSTFGDTPLLLETSAGSEQFALPNPRHIQAPLIQTIVDSLLGHGTCPSTGVSAARTSLVMDRALAGYYGSREDGFWKHPERWPGRSARV